MNIKDTTTPLYQTWILISTVEQSKAFNIRIEKVADFNFLTLLGDRHEIYEISPVRLLTIIIK